MSESELKVIKLAEPEPQTFTERMWAVAYSFVVLLILLALVATIGQACWEALTPVTGLASVSWGQAFAASILVRLTGVLFNLR